MIWLIGNKGMLGTELSCHLEKTGLPFFGTDLDTDITNLEALHEFASTRSIDWIINCAAYTAVDKAEDDQAFCRKLNTDGPGNIAAVAKIKGSRFIHISTDYVFNGKGTQPYTEDDETCPTGFYGLSKRDGETRVFEENEKSYIIRTAWLYGKYGNNFVHTMLRLMKEKESISVVNDQKGSPTWAKDLSEIIIDLLKQAEEGKNIPYGIYHFTNEGEITWYNFALEIYTQARSLGILSKECDVKSCTSAEFPSKVKRPEYSVLDKTKIKKVLCREIPHWNESLHKYLKLIAEQK